LNEALPIGWNQTISQPLVVAFMLELLQPERGEKVLDVGSGSGWTSALLAHIVGPKGKVVAIEIIPELMEFGRANAAKYNFVKKGIIEFICADGSRGCREEAPFDKILASAEARRLPPAWKEQLRTGGRIVVPIGASVWLFVKKPLPVSSSNTLEGAEGTTLEGGEVEMQGTEYPGFAFVPLKEK
jgi:protein-L-isoaspartate(D-aspartate) O-methyltransferase